MNSVTNQPFTVAQWTKATFWGWLIGVALILMLSSFLDSIGIEHMQFYLGVGMGAGVGFTQWLLLRKRLAISSSWIWLTILGMGIPFIIIDLLELENTSIKLAVSIAMGSLVVGLLQYQSIKKISPKASLWIWGCFLGWMLSVVTLNIINYTMTIKVAGYMNLVMALVNLVLILGGGVMLGIVTGIAWKKILAER